MAKQRPFRFGVQFNSAKAGPEWKELAKRAEKLGYDVFVMPDHFGGQFAIGPALALVAEATTKLRISTLVLQNDLRHPALVAMEAATLDVLSGGRFELGLGAGGSWMPDYEWTGIAFESPKARIERLEESLHVIKGLFAPGPFNFTGQHYTISEFEGMPKPIQPPHPPLLIGGGGKRLLSLAAREADIVSIFPSMLPAGGKFRDDESSSDAFAAKIEFLERESADRFDQLELNVLTQAVVITSERLAEIQKLSDQWQIAVNDLVDSPQVLVGTVDEIAEHVRICRDRLGISYFVVFGQFMETFAPIIAALGR